MIGTTRRGRANRLVRLAFLALYAADAGRYTLGPEFA
ncbi:hypothetical protein TBK1r_73730 [Stieleria magnilauensis]|uniref:Uncharacterized protein n=1 Tax=Stieleria magnilauensis TaxID=2527963 RepID=A0ABX5Y494_9BACT|nr:hypothetical protein TBK1r_73730 [Planctomycetes bacterium TBK1r]